MASRVRVDGQGRMVLPRWLRRGLVDEPGEITAELTPDGVLLRPTSPDGEIGRTDDGLPVLRLGQPVTNDEVLAAIDRERSER